MLSEDSFTVTDVRRRLDQLVEACSKEVDRCEGNAVRLAGSALGENARRRAEHQLGRLCGLKEAAELLDLVEVRS